MLRFSRSFTSSAARRRPCFLFSLDKGVSENWGYLRVPLKGYYKGTIRVALKGYKGLRFPKIRGS